MLMPDIKRYMTREPYTITSTESLARARAYMTEHQIRHLPVVDGDQVVGVISERDIAVLAAIRGIDLQRIEIARVMEAPLVVWGEELLDEVSARMADEKRDCVVVRGGLGLVGIFTAVDALRALTDVSRRACN